MTTTTTGPAIARIMERVEALGLKHRGSGSRFMVCCPAHEDSTPSLSVSQGERGALVKCHAGCSKADVMAAFGLSLPALFDDFTDDGAPARPRIYTIKPAKKPAPPPDPVWFGLAETAYQRLTIEQPEELYSLADNLGVEHTALRDCRFGLLTPEETERHGWQRRKAFTVPERDGQRRVVGVSLRFMDGSKGFIRGGHRGLTIPASFTTTDARTVFLVEGATDTAALLSDGARAIGRPSNVGGVDHLADLLAPLDKTVKIIVLGENDASDKGWPGREGAVITATQLRAKLKRDVAWTLPPAPHKDVRAARIARLAEMEAASAA